MKGKVFVFGGYFIFLYLNHLVGMPLLPVEMMIATIIYVIIIALWGVGKYIQETSQSDHF